jgi:hypothetical protein
MTWADSRLTVEGIKGHPFFFGADWDSLRYIAPPFVPALQSITDTSYFPTDDLGNLPDQLETTESLGSEQDLAFLGYVHRSTIQIVHVRSDGLVLFRFTFKRL